MKVKKEQFLLPKAKTVINANRGKWIQPLRKTCEFSKSITGTSISTQPFIEGLPSGLMNKIKSDLLLPAGEIIVAGNQANPLIWQQQNDILRQALTSEEKDLKCEDKVNVSTSIDCGHNLTQVETSVVPTVPPGASLLAISTSVAPQNITPIASSQVIKMNDYQVILSSQALPATWQDKRKKIIPQAVTSLPPIKPKMESGIIIGDQQLTFTSLSNVNILGHNQFSTIVIKDGKSSLPKNITGGNIVIQNSMPKKPLSKTVSKMFKVRKKPVQAKKIMLKPASSLLTQTALDNRNKDCKECDVVNVSQISMPLEDKTAIGVSAHQTVKNGENPMPLVSTPSPVTVPGIILTTQGNIDKINSDLLSKNLENNPRNYTNYNESISYVKKAKDGKEKEGEIVYDTVNVGLIDCSTTNKTVHLYSQPGLDEQTVILNPSTLSEHKEHLENTNQISCKDQLLQTNELKENDSNVQNIIDLTRSDVFNQNHIETIILPTDIDHNEEHHTQEYTDNLLSQLSDSGALPNMSCSQVSSVLNALGSSEKLVVNVLSTSEKSTKEGVKCEPMEFVKIENLQLANSARKVKSSEPKYRLCELNKTTCFRCISCMFISLKAKVVEKHWMDHHKFLRTRCFDKQSKRQIKCIGCTNVFYSKYALQIHLICDHNITTTEVHELIAVILSANRNQTDLKKQSNVKSTIPKSKGGADEPEIIEIISVEVPSSVSNTVYQPSVNPMTAEFPESDTGPDLPIETNVVPAESPKVDSEEKVTAGQEQGIPPTPSFGLFSKILDNNDKEEASPQESVSPPTDNDNKKTISYKKLTKCIRRYKTTRNKMRPDFASEVKFNYRCMVERCGVRVSSMDNLTYHFRCHKTDSDMLFCPECDFSVINWSSLTPHLWREHKVDIDLYTCKHCNYKSNSYSKLINNHIKIHGDERPFLCDICGKGFKTTKQLRNHKGIHRARRKYMCSSDIRSGESENTELNSNCSDYICNICSRSFADSRILKQHTENVHNKARPYLCTFCSHAASSKSSLQMHIRQHTGEKPFSCDECAYVTSDHNSLRRHKMRHSGKRPYQCPHCTYNCIQATTYKCHLKNKHPGLDEGLMFSCPMCPFRTVKKDNYLAHKAEHDLGGDPRNRRKKTQLPTEIVQEQSTPICKTITYFPDQADVTVLLDHSSIQDHGIQLVIPEASQGQIL